MKRIRVLNKHIANQIAAGEVVERPLSVVKELVENAIDAGATSITVEIQNGGIDYIRVADNGVGIPKEDCLLAFERHATSKISAQEDLGAIQTLGFRGEALASIASVAQVEMRTCTRQDEEGMLIRMEGGAKKQAQPVGCPSGTSVTVENLFYNVPARRKFLKSVKSEAAAISDFMARMILVRPDIAFRYTNNQKPIYQSAGDGNSAHALYSVYGSEVLENVREVSYDDGYIAVRGFIGLPEIAWQNRSHQSFFLNGRLIHSAAISAALLRAYDMHLMSKRYPFAVLFLTISPNEVDVNVHPAKLEVRFAQESRVLDTVQGACREVLIHTSAIPEMHLSDEGQVADEGPSNVADAVENISEAPSELNVAYSADIIKKALLPENLFDFSAPIIQQGTLRVKESEYTIPHYQVITPEEPQATLPADTEQESFGELPLKVLGQAFDSYWIVQHDTSLYLIDQHAAHERKLYEKMMSADRVVSAQELLVAELIRFSHVDYAVLMDNLDELCAIGFEIEPFGDAEVRVFSVPSELIGANISAMLRDAVELLKQHKAATTNELRRAAIIQSSCKHAIKAGDAITDEEFHDIITFFLDTGTPMRCPHGRPIIVRLQRREIEKLFKRIV